MRVANETILRRLQGFVKTLCLTQEGKYAQVLTGDNYPGGMELVDVYTPAELATEIELILDDEDYFESA